MSATSIDIVLPAHNEGPSIKGTLTEFYDVVGQRRGLPIRFIVCEDGSTDNTVEVVEELSKKLPIHLITSTERKGYSRAVLDGLRQASAPLVGFIDSDGQCDPTDFFALYEAVDEVDLAIGYRSPRRDPMYRKLMSGAFKMVYEGLFPVRLDDPSCPFLVIRRSALDDVLAGQPGLLREGFWWEFNARAHAAGLTVRQLPVTHRVRTDGTTKVYSLRRTPSIAAKHLKALVELRRELQALPRPVLTRSDGSETGPTK
jgi:glycosyltransferase involved in cell wall biosynthesis